MEKWTITGGLYVRYSTSLILASYASDKTGNFWRGIQNKTEKDAFSLQVIVLTFCALDKNLLKGLAYNFLVECGLNTVLQVKVLLESEEVTSTTFVLITTGQKRKQFSDMCLRD